MQTNTDEQVLRLFMLVHKVCLPVVRDYFDKVILASDKYNNDFKTFLRTHKHEIYHMMFPERCCQCITSQRTNCGNHRLFQKQFTKMYKEGCTEAGHVKYQRGKICEHCSCRFVENENCSTKDMDLAVFHALISKCVPNLPPTHKMWLDKIIKERHKLCHMSSSFTKEQSKAMWDYLDGSVLGLSTDIPPRPSYKDQTSAQIWLLNDIDFGIDTVKPIMNTMIQEVSEMNNNMNGMIQAQEQMQAQVAEVYEKVTKSTSEIISRLDEIKGKLTHQNGGIKCDVEYSSEAPVTDDSKKQICVKYVITSPSLTDSDMKDVKRSLQNAAASVDVWRPYKIVFVEDGSVVIGTLLPVEVFENKERFENSIRYFLDQFTVVSRLSNKHDVKIKVSVVVSSAVSKMSSHHDSNVQVKTETGADNTISRRDNMPLDISFRFGNMITKEEDALNEILKWAYGRQWFSLLNAMPTVGNRQQQKCGINIINKETIRRDLHHQSDINVLLDIPSPLTIASSSMSWTSHSFYQLYSMDELNDLCDKDSVVVCIGCHHSWMAKLETEMRKKFPGFASQEKYDLGNQEECSRCKEEKGPLYLRLHELCLLAKKRGFLIASAGLDVSQLVTVGIKVYAKFPVYATSLKEEIKAILVSEHMTQSAYDDIIKDNVTDIQIVLDNQKLNVKLDAGIRTEYCKDVNESAQTICNIMEETVKTQERTVLRRKENALDDDDDAVFNFRPKSLHGLQNLTKFSLTADTKKATKESQTRTRKFPSPSPRSKTGIHVLPVLSSSSSDDESESPIESILYPLPTPRRAPLKAGISKMHSSGGLNDAYESPIESILYPLPPPRRAPLKAGISKMHSSGGLNDAYESPIESILYPLPTPRRAPLKAGISKMHSSGGLNDAYERLQREVNEIRDSVRILKERLKASELSLARLMKTKATLEHDTSIKDNSLKCDFQYYMGMRKGFPINPKGPVFQMPIC